MEKHKISSQLMMATEMESLNGPWREAQMGNLNALLKATRTLMVQLMEATTLLVDMKVKRKGTLHILPGQNIFQVVNQ